MDPAVTDLVLEMYNFGKHLGNESQYLRLEGFYKNHSVSIYSFIQTRNDVTMKLSSLPFYSRFMPSFVNI